MLGALLGAGAGLLSGALSNQKEGGTTAGNAYQLTPEQQANLRTIQQQSVDAQSAYGGDPTRDVQNNAILGQLYGQGGSLSNAVGQEKDLANRGYSLQPEDYEAYGQASGNIARMFGQNEQSLSQAMADRGLSNSGAAASGFSGLMGNKQEQLAGLQRQIAGDRMKMNMDRLNQTRNFIAQMGSQANTAINDEQGRGIDKSNQYNQVLQNRFNNAGKMLGNFQDQANENLQQMQQTQHGSGLSNAMSGAMIGGMSGAQIGSGMSGGVKKKDVMAGENLKDFGSTT